MYFKLLFFMILLKILIPLWMRLKSILEKLLESKILFFSFDWNSQNKHFFWFYLVLLMKCQMIRICQKWKGRGCKLSMHHINHLKPNWSNWQTNCTIWEIFIEFSQSKYKNYSFLFLILKHFRYIFKVLVRRKSTRIFCLGILCDTWFERFKQSLRVQIRWHSIHKRSQSFITTKRSNRKLTLLLKVFGWFSFL